MALFPLKTSVCYHTANPALLHIWRICDISLLSHLQYIHIQLYLNLTVFEFLLHHQPVYCFPFCLFHPQKHAHTVRNRIQYRSATCTYGRISPWSGKFGELQSICRGLAPDYLLSIYQYLHACVHMHRNTLSFMHSHVFYLLNVKAQFESRSEVNVVCFCVMYVYYFCICSSVALQNYIVCMDLLFQPD